MRASWMVSVLAVSACNMSESDVGGVVQEVADPAPAFSIQSARFSNAIASDPTMFSVAYCGSSPQAACAATPVAQVRWGTQVYATEQSGLGFAPAAALDLHYDESFDLGELTHFNFPTYAGTGASGVTLDLHLLVDSSDSSGPLFDQEIHIPFAVHETPNDDPETPCPYPSVMPCSDKITFGTSTFNLGAATATTNYELEIVGFVDATSSTPADGLISEEYDSTSAVLRAMLREACIDVDADGTCDEVDACIGDEVACPPDPCPCDSDWKNHGEYVSCVAHYTQDLVKAGSLSHQDRASIVSAAGQSSCGK
ncbi:MAG TPA: choice-of-anchor K domain-containing protein [Kofleriaceae bacterium]|nr:choice-of-anchor K domain-containing protein [Kofleriaceae bacterium]